jgi:hypothetical protein
MPIACSSAIDEAAFAPGIGHGNAAGAIRRRIQPAKSARALAATATAAAAATTAARIIQGRIGARIAVPHVNRCRVVFVAVTKLLHIQQMTSARLLRRRLVTNQRWIWICSGSRIRRGADCREGNESGGR